MTAVTRLKRKAAKRPEQRTVTVTLTGEFAGWEATARADFPARWLAEFDTADFAKFTTFMERIVLDHNMPDSEDNVAASMADVDPSDGLVKMCDAVLDAIGALPKR